MYFIIILQSKYKCNSSKWLVNARINTHTKLEHFDQIISKLNEPQRQLFSRSAFGSLLPLHHAEALPSKVTRFPSRIINHLVLRLCQGSNENELTFKINRKVRRFGIKDYALMTGLNCQKPTQEELDYLKSRKVINLTT